LTRRTLRREIETLVFALNTNGMITGNPRGVNIIDDFQLVSQYYRIPQQKRNLLWALLIGRSVDSFTKFFLTQKGCALPAGKDDFNRRILRICDPSHLRDPALRALPPLTSDLTIQTDLDDIRLKRNNLFHNSGVHFTPQEMEQFIFQSSRSLQQLVLDI
jgi:hypothetical protein